MKRNHLSRDYNSGKQQWDVAIEAVPQESFLEASAAALGFVFVLAAIFAALFLYVEYGR